MTQQIASRLPLTLLPLLVFMPCCQSSSSLSRAEITISSDENGKLLDPAASTVIQVTDKHALAKLASFFPQMGNGWQSPIAAGWMSGAQIKFFKTNGTVIPVSVSINDGYKTWSEGKGDWPVWGDLASYLHQLRTPPIPNPTGQTR